MFICKRCKHGSAFIFQYFSRSVLSVKDSKFWTSVLISCYKALKYWDVTWYLHTPDVCSLRQKHIYCDICGSLSSPNDTAIHIIKSSMRLRHLQCFKDYVCLSQVIQNLPNDPLNYFVTNNKLFKEKRIARMGCDYVFAFTVLINLLGLSLVSRSKIKYIFIRQRKLYCC